MGKAPGARTHRTDTPHKENHVNTTIAPGTRVNTPDGPGTITEQPFQMASGWTVRVDLDTPTTASGHARYTTDKVTPEPLPLAYTADNHYPVLVTYYSDDQPFLETVTAPTHADAIRCAAYIYQGAHDIQVIPTTVAVRISADADIEEETTPAVVLLAAALLAAHAPAYTVTAS